jgi:rare lipoprotein A
MMNKYHFILFFFMLFLLLYCGSGSQLQGIASWYGEEWHGKKTANGEIYDMYSMTAAHKTLPFGTIVKVKDLDSGKEVVVRINNRGPFIKGRVIDLSYAAAQKLDILDKGITPCKITIIKMPKNE